MTKVTDSGFQVTGQTTFICDYSPPRSGDSGHVDTPPSSADFLLVNRNPGRAVRTDSAMLAAHLKNSTGHDPIFALITRDMNRLAIQSYLLGAQLLGLQNVVVAQGDPFTGSPPGKLSAVHDYRPTELIAAIKQLNQGIDFRGRQLDSPTNFCVGATLDPGGDVSRQINLVRRKVEAGADFLVSQPIFDAAEAVSFEANYAASVGSPVPIPIYWGLQLLESGSIAMGTVPRKLLGELANGRPGLEIALETCEAFRQASLRNIYVLPAILPRGRRNYAAAQQFMAADRALG